MSQPILQVMTPHNQAAKAWVSVVKGKLHISVTGGHDPLIIVEGDVVEISAQLDRGVVRLQMKREAHTPD